MRTKIHKKKYPINDNELARIRNLQNVYFYEIFTIRSCQYIDNVISFLYSFRLYTGYILSMVLQRCSRYAAI